MLLLVKSGGEKALPEWQKYFREADPRLDVRGWTDPSVRPEDVRYVLVWEPEEGRLSQMAGLKAVFSAGAGVEAAQQPLHLPARGVVIDDLLQGAAAQILAQLASDSASIAAAHLARPCMPAQSPLAWP